MTNIYLLRGQKGMRNQATTLETAIALLASCKGMYSGFESDGTPISLYARFVTALAGSLHDLAPDFDIGIMRKLCGNQFELSSKDAYAISLSYLGLLSFLILEKDRSEYFPALEELFESVSMHTRNFSTDSLDMDTLAPLCFLYTLKKIQERHPDFLAKINANEKIEYIYQKLARSYSEVSKEAFLLGLNTMMVQHSPNKRDNINRLKNGLFFLKNKDEPALPIASGSELSDIRTLMKFYMETTNNIGGSDKEKINFDELMLPFFIDAMRTMTQEQIIDALAHCHETLSEQNLYHFDSMVLITIFASPLQQSQWMQLTEFILKRDFLSDHDKKSIEKNIASFSKKNIDPYSLASEKFVFLAVNAMLLKSDQSVRTAYINEPSIIYQLLLNVMHTSWTENELIDKGWRALYNKLQISMDCSLEILNIFLLVNFKKISLLIDTLSENDFFMLMNHEIDKGFTLKDNFLDNVSDIDNYLKQQVDILPHWKLIIDQHHELREILVSWNKHSFSKIQKYSEFVDKFDTAQKLQYSETRWKDYSKKHKDNINFLFITMDTHALSLIQTLLEKSPAALEKFFTDFSICSLGDYTNLLKDYFSAHQDLLSTKKGLMQWANILSNVTNIEHYIHLVTTPDIFMTQIKENILSTPGELLNFLDNFYPMELSEKYIRFGLQEEFFVFYKKFDATNQDNPDDSQRTNTIEFFSKYMKVMLSLVELMGVAGLEWLNSLLTKSVSFLKKTLNEIPFNIPWNIKLFLKSYLEKNLTLLGGPDYTQLNSILSNLWNCLTYVEKIYPIETFIKMLEGKGNSQPDELLTWLKNFFPNELSKQYAPIGLSDRYIVLYEKFDRINANHFDEFQKKHPVAFFLEHKEKINFLVEVMGEAGFKWMSDQLAQTILPLERLLNEMPDKIPKEITIFLKAYFEKNSKEILKKENLESWKNIIIGIKANYDYEINSGKYILRLYINNFLNPYKKFQNSLQEFSVFINDSLLNAIFRSMGLSEEDTKKINRDQLFASLPIDKFAQLSVERLHFELNSGYGNVLDSLINCYLTQQPVDAFLHDVNQASILGKQLAAHNRKIQSAFHAHQIDIEKALHYKATYEFSILPKGFDSLMEKTRSMEVLCDFLKATIDEMLCSITLLQTAKKTASEKQKSAIDLLIKEIRAIEKNHKQFIKDAKAPLQLYEKTHWPLLTTIRDSLTRLLSNAMIRDDKQFISLREFSTHFVDQYVIAEEKSKVVTPKASEQKPAHFRVEQWDKEKISTLFLGNEVDCCLAVGSTQFQAIVQRIMDDAMQFHVVVDLETNKPIALTWLYFGEDAKKNIYLTGNFIEIKAKYGSNEYMRETIVNALLHFTGEMYCPDAGINKFIINELTYGWSAGKLTPFSKEVVRLTDKVGGAFVPAENYDYQSPQELTSNRYYLASLNRAVNASAPEFHIYKPEAITPDCRRAFMSVDERVETLFMNAFYNYKKRNPSASDIAILRAIEPDVRKSVIVVMGVFFDNADDSKKLTDILETVKEKHFYSVMIQQCINDYRKSYGDSLPQLKAGLFPKNRIPHLLSSDLLAAEIENILGDKTHGDIKKIITLIKSHLKLNDAPQLTNALATALGINSAAVHFVEKPEGEDKIDARFKK